MALTSSSSSPSCCSASLSSPTSRCQRQRAAPLMRLQRASASQLVRVLTSTLPLTSSTPSGGMTPTFESCHTCIHSRAAKLPVTFGVHFYNTTIMFQISYKIYSVSFTRFSLHTDSNKDDPTEDFTVS